MEAFYRAEQLGADGFEFDVQLTRDGVPVVIHDETLNRTTNGQGYVYMHTLDELRALDAGSWYAPQYKGLQIPTLQEVIETFGGRMVLNIELKNSIFDMPGLEEKTLDLIRCNQIENSVVVSSFHHGSMQKFHALAPDIKCGLLYDCVIVGATEYAERLGASALHPFFATVKPELVAEAHRAGLEVNVWTVNEMDHMRLAVLSGVDAMITNYPDRLKSVLESSPII
ncbi:hypothetical protein EL26_19555 [Tumebacillus flagellatus]|uniref:GP-PDE domain-containing protein n=2 Tax=Tumebacillus flagellatus TaxID=1157490 RepID=A0A074LKP5_9BACL|nr:hypothetical protein EL26_19555 [Tumebacillus flagellatus]